MIHETKMKNGAGFTLAELLVVTGIIVILSAITLPSFRVGEKQFALQRSAHKLAQDIRRVQEMTMSMKGYSCPAGSLKGYGAIFFINSPTDYSLFAQCDTSSAFEALKFEKGVKVQNLAYYKDGTWHSDQASLWFYFTPPDPTVEMMAVAGEIKITLALENDLTKIKTVRVNKAGLINVE